MFASHHCQRLDFADTQAGVHAGAELAATSAPAAGPDAPGVRELLAGSGAADRHLLTLLACTAAATLLLALASSLA